MGVSEAGEILRRHVIERRHRNQPQSVDPAEDPSSAIPRMSEPQFADSCLLVKGVSEWTLKMLESWYCDSLESTWTVDAVRVRGKLVNVPIAQVAVRLTLRQAAERVGLGVSPKQARTLYMEAMSVVTDNLVERASRLAGWE
jgi:hypothetical protein